MAVGFRPPYIWLVSEVVINAGIPALSLATVMFILQGSFYAQTPARRYPDRTDPFAMKKQRGFTIVELILVIVIIGILAAVVGPRFFTKSNFDERFYFEEVLSSVRYAQKLAVASGCYIQFSIGSEGYALNYYDGGDCGTGQVQDPAGGGHYAKSLKQGVAVQNPLTLTFNSLGSTNATCPGGICTATVGGFTFRIHAATGFIEAIP